MACIAADGIHKSSMQRIAKKAGLTPSLIIHYFKDRSSLIQAVYLHLYDRMDVEIRRRVKLAKTPRERIYAICDAQIAEEFLTQEIVVTWITLYALIPEIPFLRRVDGIYTARMRSNLVYHLKALNLSHQEALSFANEIAPLIDGLWARKSSNANLTNEEMRQIVHGYLDRQLHNR